MILTNDCCHCHIVKIAEDHYITYPMTWEEENAGTIIGEIGRQNFTLGALIVITVILLIVGIKIWRNR